MFIYHKTLPQESLREEIYVEPTFLAIVRKRDSASDSFIVAFHVEVMTDIRVVFFLIRVALAACHEGLFVFPHHFEVCVRNFDGSFFPRSVEVRSGILSHFAAITKVSVGLTRLHVSCSLVVGTGLFFFGGESQGAEIFGRAVFVNFIQAFLTPMFAEERIACGGFRVGARNDAGAR